MAESPVFKHVANVLHKVSKAFDMLTNNPFDSTIQKQLQQAKAIATVLEGEFQSPVRILDAQAGHLIWPADESERHPEPSISDVEQFAQQLANGTITSHVVSSNGLRLRLPICLTDSTAIIAETVIRLFANSDEARQQEVLRSEHWATAVLERLLQADALRNRRHAEDDLRSQVKNAWEVNLALERAIRHAKVHREIGTGIEQILNAALPFVGAKSLVWVTQKFDHVLVRGEQVLSGYDVIDFVKSLRRSEELRDTGLLLTKPAVDLNQSAKFPAVHSAMMLVVPVGNSYGWIVAINRKDDVRREGFSHSDAAALAPFASLIGFLVKSSDRYQDLKDLLVGLTRSLASAVDAKDPYTYGHSERVARIAVELGRELRLGDDELSDIYLAGLLHDVGKIGVRDDVLCKHGPLTPDETEHIKQHPVIGHSILKDLNQISSLLPGVLHHHERFDGKGYPHSLEGENIPRIARILAVADSYDAMSTSRPYRQAMSPTVVEDILAKGSGQQWDPRVIDAFQRIVPRLRSIRERGLGESLRHALDGALRDNNGSSRIMPMNLVSPVAMS